MTYTTYYDVVCTTSSVHGSTEHQCEIANVYWINMILKKSMFR